MRTRIRTVVDYLARWFYRAMFVLAAAIALPAANAWALVVDGGSTVNTNSAGFNSIFYNVGSFNGGSAVYLGDGWALTAQHVGVPLPGSGVEFVSPNGTVTFSLVQNTLTLPSDPDLRLVRLATPPPLPAIYQNIPTTLMTTGSIVAFVGDGDTAGSPINWNSATSNGTTLTMGTMSGSPASSINPIPSDTLWHTGSVPSGTYQDAGFWWNSNRELQWGKSVVTFANTPVSAFVGGNSTVMSQTFATTFYNSTYDPPSIPAWATEVSAIGSNAAEVATGDSGGAAFVKTSSGWALAGTLEAALQIGVDRGNAANAAFGDLSYAIDLSQYVSAIQNVVNTTTTWTGQTGPGATSTTWNTSTSNWVNAANNATATFTANSGNAQGNAVFSDANPQFGIRLNPSLSMATSGIAPQTISVQSSGVAAYSITFTNTGASNGGTDYLIGNAGSNGISGSTGITLSGNGSGVSGAVYLTGPNSFTGPIRVYAGQLVLENATAMGDSVFPLTYNSSNYNVVASGAAIDLLSTSQTTFGKFATSGLALALNGSGIGGTGSLNNLGGNNTYAGPITLASSSVTIGSSSTTGGDQLSITGGITTQGNSLTIVGPGNTTITTTAVNGGGTFCKSGSGTLTLDFTGAGSPTANLITSNAALTVAGGTLAINGIASGGSSQTFASLAVNSGATAITNTSNGSSSTLTFTSGTIARAIGGTVDFTLPASGSVGFSSPPALSGGILGGWATVSGGSWVTLSGNNLAAYGSATPVNSNSTLSSGTNYDITGSFTAGSGSAANSLRFLNGATGASVALSGTVPNSAGGILVPASVTSADSISGGTLEGASGADLVVIQNSAQPLTISSTIADNGSATGLTKSGSGSLILAPSTSNAYSGTTTLNAGTLVVNNLSALGTGTFVINGGAINSTVSGVTTNNPETWNGSFTFVGANSLSQTTGAITLTASPTITLSTGASTLSIGGNIGGSFGLGIAGSGTLALGGSNTFTGGTMISGGTLQINSGGALNASNPNVVSFGSISAGVLNLNGNSITVGGLSGMAATGAVLASAVSGTASATLTIGGGGNYNFGGLLNNGGSGTLSLIKTGSGIQILSGSDQYSGGTTVSGGVLEFAADSNVPVTGTIAINAGGAVADAAALDQIFLGHIAGGSLGSVALGANSTNTLSFAGLSASLGSIGNYTYSGTLTPNSSGYVLGGGGGLLTVGSSTLFSGSNPVTLVNGGSVALTNTGNSYTGGTTISTGTTLLVSSDAASAGGDNEIGQVPLTAATNITINGGTLAATNSFTLNANRLISLGSGGTTFDVNGAGPSTLIYNGIISDLASSAGGITLTDTGILTLGGPNTYTGATNITSGTLSVTATNTLPQVSAVVLGPGATLLLNGFSQNIGSLSGGGNVTDNSSNSITLTIGNDNTTPTMPFYGVLSDTTANNAGKLSLSKVGTGTTSISGINTYTGGTTVSNGTLATVSGGVLGPGALTISAANGILPLVSIGGSQTINSLMTSSAGTGQSLLNIAAGDTLTSNGALTNTGTLVFGTGGTGTLLINTVPTLNTGSSIQINSGKLEFAATSGTATIQSNVTVSVAPAATLQLAGSKSPFSNGTQTVNITNNGSLASGGGLSVTGLNQTVGTISGTPTTLNGAAVYSGDTVVGPSATLTANQILQNSLIIGAGATVSIRPSSASAQVTTTTDSTASTSTSAASSSSSLTNEEIDRLQNHIAALEQLYVAAENSSASVLDSASSAAIGSAVASNSNLSGTSAALYANEINIVLGEENTLLAEEGLPPASLDISLSGGLSPSVSLSAGSAVPEPSGLVLVLLFSGLVVGWCVRQSGRRRLS